LSHGLCASLGAGALAVKPEGEPSPRLTVFRHDAGIRDAAVLERDQRPVDFGLTEASDVHPVAFRRLALLRALPRFEPFGLEKRRRAHTAGEIDEWPHRHASGHRAQ